MKFKVLKDFISSIVKGVEGAFHDLELDEPTAKMWTENGLIEEVKEEPAHEATTSESDVVVPETAPPQEDVKVPPENVTAEQSAPASTADPAPVDVTADENK